MRLWSKRLPRRARHLLIALVLSVGLCGTILVVVDQWILPLPEELLQRSNATFVYSQEGRLLTAFTSNDYFWRRPVALDQKLLNSVITTEDRYFYLHP